MRLPLCSEGSKPVMSTSASSLRRWEHFEHMADIGVRGIGPSREAAFEEAALAMSAVITDLALVCPAILVEVDVDAREDELLFVDWLNALIYEMSAHRLIFSRFEARISDGHLHGRAWGEVADPERHHPAVEIRAFLIFCEDHDPIRELF